MIEVPICKFTFTTGKFRIIHEGVYHNIFVSNKNKKKWFVFFQGATDKSRVQPDFQRISWSEEIDGNLLIFADPTIDNSDLNIGWGQYNSGVNYFYWQAKFIQNMVEELATELNELVLFGSSAGGFNALMVAAYLKKVKVIVNNPQIFWSQFYPNKVRLVLNSIYDGISIEEYEKIHINKSNPIHLFTTMNVIPDIYYLQNKKDDFHYNFHFLPFLNFILKSPLHTENVKFHIYDNEIENHNPVSKNVILKILHSI